MARGFANPNPNFEWFDSRGNVLTNFVQYPGVLSDGSYTAVSHLEIAPNDWNKGNSFKCQVGDSKGKQKTIVAKPGPVTLNISPPRAKELYMEKKAIIECVISGSTEHDVDKTVSWTFGSKRDLSVNNSNVQGGEKQYTKSSVLTISSSDWFSGNEVQCNTGGAKPVKTSYKRESEPSVFIYTSDLNKNTITLVCEVSSPHPSSVYVSWNVDNTQPIDGNHTAFIQKSDGNKCVNSYLTVTKEKYEKSMVTCAVYHGVTDKPKVSSTSKNPITLSISPPRAKELYMEKKAIIECVISGSTEHYVDKAVSWTFGSKRDLSVNNSNVQGGEKQYTKSSVLTISSSDWFSGKEVQCNTAGAKPVKTNFKTESVPSVLIYTSDLHGNNITLVCEVTTPHLSSVYIRWKVDHTQLIDGNHTAFIRNSDGNTFVYSYLTVTNEKYEKSLFECAVYHGDKDKPKLSATSKSKPQCPLISCDD